MNSPNNPLLVASVALLILDYAVLFYSWKVHHLIAFPILLAVNVGILYAVVTKQDKSTLKNTAGDIVSILGILSILVVVGLIVGGILGYYYHNVEGIAIPVVATAILVSSLVIVSKLEKQ